MPPRKTTYSQDCYDAWAARNDPQAVRRIVYERDHGVCSICQCSTDALKAALRTAFIAWADGDRASPRPMPPAGFPGLDRTWWEADHIIPVVEGGGGCGPEGYRTACLPCHKVQTKALAARRAARRRPSVKAVKTPSGRG